MAVSGITVLKHNVPWGPFTRAQIDDGLARGDFTLRSLAHTAGLSEWLPLGEVLDHMARQEMPPLPTTREFPPIPERPVPPPPAAIPQPPPAPVAEAVPERLVVSVPPPRKFEPVPPMPSSPPPAPAHAPVPSPVADAPELKTAPFFLRGIAFLVDCGVIFSPVVVLFVLGMLSIEAPTLFKHESAQAITEQRAALWHNAWRMAGLLAIGCGWLYASWYESSPAQATIGKRWMGLKVVDVYGERISFVRASGRFVAKFPSALPCFLGFIMALFSSSGRALHDRLSGTRVVRD